MIEPLLFLPSTGAPPHPLILWIHGGGWSEGSPSLPDEAPQRIVLMHGYALASVAYRLSGEATFPAQIRDVFATVQWLRERAPGLGLDPQRIGAWGESAGGHLAAMLGAAGGVAEFTGGSNVAVRAVVVWYGPTDFLAMDEQTRQLGCREFPGGGHDGPGSPESKLMGFPIQSSSVAVHRADPAAHVTADVPPFLIQHGDRDCWVPWLQSRHLADRIAAVAGPDRVTLDVLPAGHGGEPFTNPHNLARVIAFFDATLR